MSDSNDPNASVHDSDDSTRPLSEARDAIGANLVGKTIGQFRISGIIGRGGMGAVYEAEQEHPRRTVALKVVNAGVASESMLRRFQHESNVLGRLQHPNIAYIFEAGTFDIGAGEQPFFAMELVRGLTLTHYAASMNLSSRQRLELLIKICKAVQYAHQKGIIHRDLKPGNILVTDDGEPKVLDFGVARTIDSDIHTTTLRTDIGQLIGTIPYMSPEQAGGNPDELDTRSDVYALGVVAYELLAGRLPYDLRQKMIHEAVRVIREDEPTRLSSLNPTLRGDVEIIIGKALEKEKERRYQSANDFASDIERYLNDQPIVARPPSAAYQFRKFARRNKALVGGVATVFMVLVGSLIGLSLLYAQTEEARADAVAARDAEAEQRRIAEQREAEAEAAREAEAQRAEELEQVAEFQASQLADIETERMGIGLRRDILDQRRAALQNHRIEDAEIEAAMNELETSLAGVNFTNLALTTLKDNIFERAIKAIDTQFETQPLVRARLLQTVADTLRDLGLLELATDPQERALAIRREQLGDDHSDTLLSLNNMGFVLHAQGKLDEAEPYYRAALEGRRRVLGDEHRDTLSSINNMGGLLQNQGKFDEAEPYYRATLEGYRRLLGDQHPDTLTLINNMGGLLESQGRRDEVEPYYREALEGRRRVLGNDHPSTLSSINNMGFLLRIQGRLDEAEAYFREALEGRRRVLGDEHPSTLISINSMGVLLRSQGKLDEAEPYYREALAARRRVLGDEHPSTLSSINNMGSLFQAQGKFDEAEQFLFEVLQVRRRVLGDDHPSTLVSLNNMGFLLRAQGKFVEAEPYYREALEARRRVLGDNHPDTLLSIDNMGLLLRDLGRLDEANSLGNEAVGIGREVFGSEHRNFGAILSHHAHTLTAMSRYADAEERALEAYAVLSATLGENHDRTQGVARHIAELYTAWHEAEPDAGHDATAAQWRAKLPTPDGADNVADDDDSESGE